MPVARMAVQFRPTAALENGVDAAAGWKVTGKSPFTSSTIHFKTGLAVPTNCWGEVRQLRLGVDRDYGGINSSGGPQQSGRADHRLIHLDRNCDQISQELFRRCCNGLQLRRVVIFDPDFRYNATDASASGLLIVAEDCHVTSYEMVLEKSSATRHEAASMGLDQGSEYVAVSRASSQSDGATTRMDRLTILYTRISLRVGNATGSMKGWDTGTETKWDPESDYTVT